MNVQGILNFYSTNELKQYRKKKKKLANKEAIF